MRSDEKKFDRRAVLRAGLATGIPAALAACATTGGGADAVGSAGHAGSDSTAVSGSRMDNLTGTVMNLWPGTPPGGEHVTVTQEEVERSKDPTFHDVAIVHTTTPTLTLYRPERPNGASMLIIPGGGYQRVVVGKEGLQIAKWLLGEGITCFVLLYRLPADGWAAGPDAPLQDAQRALRLIRGQATRLALDTNRVGVMGFSAGGHLAARTATRFALQTYEPVDGADTLSARPDLACLGYPVISFKTGVAHMGSRNNMLGPHPDETRINAYSAEIDVPSQAPPCFLMCAADDPAVPVENSWLMFKALREAKIPAALHVFESGGHGFGLQTPKDSTVSAWPGLFLDWSRQHHFMGTVRG